jgi:transmembrane sensor
MPDRRTLSKAERQATSWIVRVKAHDVTERDRQDFQSWLAADPEHVTAYAKLERTWGLIAGNPALKGLAGAETPPAPMPRHLKALALAIAAAAVLALGGYAWVAHQSAPPAQHIATEPGALRTITLADGSTIELSGASEAVLAVGEHERRVELLEGHALFDVTHDSGRPFVVETPQGDIRVLGTQFVVRIAGDTVRTTVLRGAVLGVADSQGLFSGHSGRVTAHMNEEIILSAGNAELIEISAEAIPRRLAWRENMLAFDGESLADAIAEVAQQTGWRFELADPELGQLRVGGYIAADPDAFLTLLTTSLHLTVAHVGERHVVISGRRRD